MEIVVKLNENIFSKYFFFSCNYEKCEVLCTGDINQSISQGSNKNVLK